MLSHVSWISSPVAHHEQTLQLRHSGTRTLQRPVLPAFQYRLLDASVLHGGREGIRTLGAV